MMLNDLPTQAVVNRSANPAPEALTASRAPAEGAAAESVAEERRFADVLSDAVNPEEHEASDQTEAILEELGAQLTAELGESLEAIGEARSESSEPTEPEALAETEERQLDPSEASPDSSADPFEPLDLPQLDLAESGESASRELQDGATGTASAAGPQLPASERASEQAMDRAAIEPGTGREFGRAVAEGAPHSEDVPGRERAAAVAEARIAASPAITGPELQTDSRPETDRNANARERPLPEPPAGGQLDRLANELAGLRAGSGPTTELRELPPEPLALRNDLAVDGTTRRADAPSAENTRALPELPASNEAAIVRHARMLVDQNGGRVRLQLNPPQLGALDLRLSVINNSVQLEVVADRLPVAEILGRHLPELRAALEAHGLQIDRVNIDVRGRDAESRDGTDSHEASRHGEPGAEHRGNEADSGFAGWREGTAYAARSLGAVDVHV